MRGRGGSGSTFVIVIQQLTVIYILYGFNLAKYGTCNYDRPGTGFGDRGVSGTGQQHAAIP